jgi:hypothetical protein
MHYWKFCVLRDSEKKKCVLSFIIFMVLYFGFIILGISTKPPYDLLSHVPVILAQLFVTVKLVLIQNSVCVCPIIFLSDMFMIFNVSD